MSRLMMAMVLLSAALHGLVVMPAVVVFESGAKRRVYDAGSGDDAFILEQGLTLEGLSFGDAAERVEIAEVTPTVAEATPPKPEVIRPVEPELQPVIGATESPVEIARASEVPQPPAEVPPEPVEAREPPPPEPPPPPPEPVAPRQTASIEQAAQAEAFADRSAGKAQDGGKAEARELYAGQLARSLRKVRVGKFKSFGTVILQFELDRSGAIVNRQILRSSGNAALDQQALDWLDRADFPRLPDTLGDREVFTVPLEFKKAS